MESRQVDPAAVVTLTAEFDRPSVVRGGVTRLTGHAMGWEDDMFAKCCSITAGVAVAAIGFGALPTAFADDVKQLVVVERATSDTVTDLGAEGDSVGDILTCANDIYDQSNPLAATVLHSWASEDPKASSIIAFTEGKDIFFRSDYYSEDFSKDNVSRQSVFIHQVQHVWQNSQKREGRAQ